jgi:dihydroflavonol-4-reductase
VASEAVAWCTGREPFATRDGLRMARQCMFFNDAKARKELGYTSRPYEQGISDALAWFYSVGMLASPRGELRRGFRLMAR